MSRYDIIPKPASLQPQCGHFALTQHTRIALLNPDAESAAVADFFCALVKRTTGWDAQPEVVSNVDCPTNCIAFTRNPTTLGPEGSHQLHITEKNIIAKASGAIGLFYAAQSIRQLLPPEIEEAQRFSRQCWNIPCATIIDAPRFRYRGLHLDVGRHFFPVRFIKKYIDLLALHKMNTFHWHLTDDQGWRVEIKKYPKLNKIASTRKETLIGHECGRARTYDGLRHNGFYTHEEIKEIVEYARERFIAVIPEIEMPGHSQAVLAAYRELGCTGGPYEVAASWGEFHDVYCAGNEEVFTFLINVLLEVVQLFPSKYIHIGGDECSKLRWEACPKCQARIRTEGLKDEAGLRSYFINRIGTFLLSQKRQIIGWDEILEGGAVSDVTVMSWRGIPCAATAAKQGHDVIMTPSEYCYFDCYQDDPKTQPLAIGGHTPLEKVYAFEPVPEGLNRDEAQHILGAQGSLWTEYIKTPEHAEYMAYPRACALSEVVWTPAENKDYGDFLSRLDRHYRRLEHHHVNAFRPPSLLKR